MNRREDNFSTDDRFRVQTDRLTTPIAASIALTFFGTVFQVGYFNSIGTEFISLMGPHDWIVSIGIFVVILPVAWGPLWVLHEGFYERNNLGTLRTHPLLRAAKIISFGPIYFILALAIACVLIWTNQVKLIWIVAAIPMVCLTIIGLAHVVQLVSISATYGSISAKDILVFFAIFGFLAYCGGDFYATHATGRSCVIFSTDGHSETGDYLRAVGSGHLIRAGQKVRFIPSDKLLELVCGT